MKTISKAYDSENSRCSFQFECGLQRWTISDALILVNVMLLSQERWLLELNHVSTTSTCTVCSHYIHRAYVVIRLNCLPVCMQRNLTKAINQQTKLIKSAMIDRCQMKDRSTNRRLLIEYLSKDVFQNLRHVVDLSQLASPGQVTSNAKSVVQDPVIRLNFLSLLLLLTLRSK